MTDDYLLLTVKEFAAWKRVHVQTIYTMIKEGRLTDYPIDRIGRAIRIVVPRGNIQGHTAA